MAAQNLSDRSRRPSIESEMSEMSAAHDASLAAAVAAAEAALQEQHEREQVRVSRRHQRQLNSAGKSPASPDVKDPRYSMLQFRPFLIDFSRSGIVGLFRRLPCVLSGKPECRLRRQSG